MKIKTNEKIKNLDNEIAKIKGVLKANSLKLSFGWKDINLSASEKSDLWDKLEKLEDELNDLLLDSDIERKSWDW